MELSGSPDPSDSVSNVGIHEESIASQHVVPNTTSDDDDFKPQEPAEKRKKKNAS
jgi:hypothetical protein